VYEWLQESIGLPTSPEEEIYETVQQMRSYKEDMEINGGDDGCADVAPAPKPTRKDSHEGTSDGTTSLAHSQGEREKATRETKRRRHGIGGT
jgi:hypothetical protein